MTAKATITRRVNNRLGTPTVNSDKGTPHEVGDEIDIITFVKGDRVEDNEIWIKRPNESHLWSGATNVVLAGKPYYKENPKLITLQEALTVFNASNGNWWQRQYQIDKIWTQYNTLGEGAKIAIVDYGITFGSPHFNYDLVTGWNYFGNNNNYKDEHSHGTGAAGVIGGHSSQQGFIGVAPNATMFICKYAGSPLEATRLTLANCLEKLIDTDIDIISISHSFPNGGTGTNELQAVMTKLQSKIIVASCGNDGNANSSKLIDKIPASSTGAISIAACDQADNILELSTKSNTISLTAPGDRLRSVGLDFSIPVTFSETSAATAYVAGIAALMTSAAKGTKSKQQILDSLLNNVKISSGQKKDRYGKGIIDPFAAIKNLLP